MAVMEVSKKEKTLQEKERKNLFKDFLLIDVPIQSFRGNIYFEFNKTYFPANKCCRNITIHWNHR